MHKAITTTLLLVTSFATHAQVLIPKIGGTLSSLRADTYVIQMDNSFNNQTGFTAGVAYVLPLTTLGKGELGIQPELSFTQKGFGVEATGEFEFEGTYQLYTKQSYTLNYLDIPVLVRYAIGGDNLKVTVTGGPAVGFALGGKYESTLTRTQDGVTETLADSKGDVIYYQDDEANTVTFDHNIEFALQGGIGVILKNRLSLEARVGTGLTNMKHDNKTQNVFSQVTVGVPITLR